MIILLTSFADTTSGVGALGFQGSAFLIQLVTFILGYLVLRKWAFDPIIRVLKERRQKIDEGVLLSEQMVKDKAALDETVTKELHKARAEADGIIAAAQETARETLRQAEEKANEKADVILAEAHERSVQEAARLRRSIEKDVTSLVAQATEAIIHEKVDQKKDAAIIERALKEQQPA